MVRLAKSDTPEDGMLDIYPSIGAFHASTHKINSMKRLKYVRQLLLAAQKQ